MQYVIPPQEQAKLKIKGSEKYFPVNRIYCVGRNYAEHAKEMGSDPHKEPPFFFQKPSDALVINNEAIEYPLKTENLHYEIELVIAIGKSGHNISIEDAQNYVWGYACGVDLTRRDLQAQAKKTGRPWEPGKAFDHSAPVSELVPVDECELNPNASIWLAVNGDQKQQSQIDKMIWSIPQIISILSESWKLTAGDLIFTGTPEGVGKINKGDFIEGGVDGLPSLAFKIV